MAARLPLSRDEADRRLLDSFKAGDTARQNPRHPGEWLISSKTHSTDSIKVSYRVQLDPVVSCGCEGFRWRGMCRHIVRASWERHQLARKKEVGHDAAHENAPTPSLVA